MLSCSPPTPVPESWSSEPHLQSPHLFLPAISPPHSSSYLLPGPFDSCARFGGGKGGCTVSSLPCHSRYLISSPLCAPARVQVQKKKKKKIRILFDLFENLVKPREEAPHSTYQIRPNPTAERGCEVREEIGKDGESGGCVLNRLYLPHHYPC